MAHKRRGSPGPLIILESEVALRFLSRPSPIDPMKKPSIFTSAALKVLQNRSVAKVLVRCGACTQLTLGVKTRWISLRVDRMFLGGIMRIWSMMSIGFLGTDDSDRF